MSYLWRWAIQRRLLEERLRTTLTLLGIALGVSVFVAMRLASHSAMASFSDTVDAVAGKANLQIVSTSEGFDERVFADVARTAGIEAAAPVVQIYARAKLSPRSTLLYDETLLVLGLDLLAEAPFARYHAPEHGERDAGLALLTDPRAAVITRTLANRHGLALGDTIRVLASGRPEPLVVRQILESKELQHAMGGNVVLVDIATAQEVFQRFGRIDRVDLLVPPAQRDSVRARIQRALPAGVTADLPQGRTRQVENMVRAFDLNLTALSFIALFVAATLIFNAVSMSVLRWRREIGILRGLGVTRGAVATLFFGEGLFFGVVGSALGLGLGTLLARGALGAVSRTLTDLYLVQDAGTLHYDAGVYVLGLALGTLVALFSALAPAFEAAATPPGVTMRQGLLIEAQHVPIVGLTLAGVLALAAAGGVAWWTVDQNRTWGGFASAFLTIVGFALLAPAFTLACERIAGAPIRRLTGIEGALGTRYLRASVARTSVVVAALMVAVGMSIALTLMVGSFRRTVDTWIGQTIRGDLYIEPVGHRASGSATTLPDSLLAQTRAIPDVIAVDTYRGTSITHAGRLAFAAGVDFDIQRRLGHLAFVRGESREVLGRALARGGVIVTESFARHYRLAAGDTLALDVPAGRVRLEVEGVFYDYSTDAGVVLMDRSLFARLWRDPRTESLAIYVRKGADVDAVRLRFLQLAGPDRVLSVTPNRMLRERVLTVFDQTFQITYALQAIAVLVAVLGVISALTALILQRGREIGVLRAIGALRGQVRTIVLVESAMIGLIGSLLGCACGWALSLILVHVINRQFFGWTIRMTVTPGVFIEAVVLMVLTAVLAGIVPARLAATRVAAEAMRAD